MADAREITGSCLCGAVRYRSGPPSGPMGHCHCESCRKAHAAAFSTTVRVAREGFRWLSGEDLLTDYESTPGKRRRFCRRCGSQLLAAWDDEDELILRAGCIDGDPGVRPVAHIWVSEGAAWYDPDAVLPRLSEGPPGRRSPGGGRPGRGGPGGGEPG